MKQKLIIRKGAVVLILSLLLTGLMASAVLAYGDWSAGGSSQQSRVTSNTIEFQNANLEDVLSALALKTGNSIMLVGENNETKPVKVNFKAQDISAARALSLIIQKQGMESVQRGGIVLVGKAEVLNKDFRSELMMTRINTYNVPVGELEKAIKDLDVGAKSVMIDYDTNAFWVQGTAQSLQKVREIAAAVDAERTQTAYEYRVITPKNISTSKMLSLLGKVGISFTRYVEINKSIYVFDRNYFGRWKQVSNLVKQLDITSNTTEDKVIVYRCKYVSAKDAARWLKEFSFGQTKSETKNDTGEVTFSAADITTITFNNDAMGSDVTVICPPELESQVISALNQIDVKRKEVKVPLKKASYQKCNALRVFINELTGVSVSKLHISSDLAEAGTTSPSREYVLWIEESPDTIKRVQDVLAQAGV